VARQSLQIDLSGPLFKADPKKTLRENMRRMLQGLAEEGEEAVRQGWPVLTGAGREGTKGRVASLSGKPWQLTAVISAQHVYDWPNGGAKQYRGGKAEARRHMFSRAAGALRRARAVLAADLTKGLE